MKRLIRKILREEIKKSDKYYTFLDRVSTMVRTPYFKSMGDFTIDGEDDQEYIMRKIYGYNVNIYETRYGLNIFNDNGSEIYFEDSDGNWEKSEYDDRGNMLYYERSDGYWEKREFNDKGNEIYYEDFDGDIIDNR